eukprot:GHUV01003190.1.p1 GENE.GHUV01003190.1~~GHUV01003190.1.p1  ORF type:complete len:133 (+),score=22.21 GHUV01003190.1:273-671(+)
MSFLELLARPSGRNLLDVLTKLPKLGVGSRVTRKSWELHGNCYWEVRGVTPRKPDGSAGKVWGLLTWRGIREHRIREINGRAKPIWRWMPSKAELAAYQPLIKELQRQKTLEKLAAQRSSAATAESTAAAQQ